MVQKLNRNVIFHYK